MEPNAQNLAFTTAAQQVDSSASGMTPSTLDHLAALASRLRARRDAILQAWRRLVIKDPIVESGALLSRVQFFDHIPEVLDLFEARLRISSEADGAAAERENRRVAAEHGVVRWQQG